MLLISRKFPEKFKQHLDEFTKFCLNTLLRISNKSIKFRINTQNNPPFALLFCRGFLYGVTDLQKCVSEVSCQRASRIHNRVNITSIVG